MTTGNVERIPKPSIQIDFLNWAGHRRRDGLTNTFACKPVDAKWMPTTAPAPGIDVGSFYEQTDLTETRSEVLTFILQIHIPSLRLMSEI